MDKDFARKELDILEKEIKFRMSELKFNNEDPDTIGTELEYSERMLNCIAVINDIFNTLVETEKADIDYMLGLISDLNHGYPLTDILAYEADDSCWVEVNGRTLTNDRYPTLIRRTIKTKDEEGNEKLKPVYTDFERFDIYNLIDDKHITSDAFYRLFTAENMSKFIFMIDQLIPIEWPYNPKMDRIKLYVEIFECSLQDDADPVKSLAITHYLTSLDNKPNKIFKFYDITDGKFEELDWRAYSTRRQIFDQKEKSELEE